MFTNSDKHPECYHPDERQPDITYINQTNGVWIRTNKNDHTTELWFDGNFQASWNIPEEVTENHIDGTIACVMMRECIDIGKRLRSKEIKALIG